MTLDKSQFIEAFLMEAQTYVDTLNQGLAHLENEPQNQDLLDELFRAAHTLKGASRMMGYEAIRNSAHKLEDLFCDLKSQATTFDQVAGEAFSNLDSIRHLLEEIPQTKTPTTNGLPNPASLTSAPLLEEYLQVPISRVNRLVNLIGEMVINKVKASYKVGLFKKISRKLKMITRNMKELEETTQLNHLKKHLGELCDFLTTTLDHLQSEVFHLDPVIDELRQKMKELKTLPCTTLFAGFPRLVRDIAAQQGKKVQLVIRGEDTELDKKVLESIRGPLIHLLRNAVDHGVSPGNTDIPSIITLSAFQESGKVVVTVADQGPGIDADFIGNQALQRGIVSKKELARMSGPEKLTLIFLQGFSTAASVTDVSGRGVGLSVVQSEVQKLKGSVKIETEKGRGCLFRIELPLTVAILRALMVESENRIWALPLLHIEKSLRVLPAEISIPTVFLSDVLDMQKTPFSSKNRNVHGPLSIVVVNFTEYRMGFIVDRLLGEEEIFLKNLGTHLKSIRGLLGVTSLADGQLVPVLDLQALRSHIKKGFIHDTSSSCGRFSANSHAFQAHS